MEQLQVFLEETLLVGIELEEMWVLVYAFWISQSIQQPHQRHQIAQIDLRGQNYQIPTHLSFQNLKAPCNF